MQNDEIGRDPEVEKEKIADDEDEAINNEETTTSTNTSTVGPGSSQIKLPRRNYKATGDGIDRSNGSNACSPPTPPPVAVPASNFIKDKAVQSRVAGAPGALSVQDEDGGSKFGPSFKDPMPNAEAVYQPFVKKTTESHYKDQVQTSETVYQPVRNETTGPRFKDQVNTNAQPVGDALGSQQHHQVVSAGATAEKPEPPDSTLLLEAQVVEE